MSARLIRVRPASRTRTISTTRPCGTSPRTPRSRRPTERPARDPARFASRAMAMTRRGSLVNAHPGVLLLLWVSLHGDARQRVRLRTPFPVRALVRSRQSRQDQTRSSTAATGPEDDSSRAQPSRAPFSGWTKEPICKHRSHRRRLLYPGELRFSRDGLLLHLETITKAHLGRALSSSPLSVSSDRPRPSRRHVDPPMS